MPILHPLDLAQLFSILCLVLWWKQGRRQGGLFAETTGLAVGVLNFSIFVWSTALLFRASHHYIGVPWDADSLWASNFIQSALSIYWSILALVLMVTAHHLKWRAVWKLGALLISIVVLKLVLIDMSNQATISRIAAFMGVGVLMLLIGYFAPIPSEREAEKPSAQNT